MKKKPKYKIRLYEQRDPLTDKERFQTISRYKGKIPEIGEKIEVSGLEAIITARKFPLIPNYEEYGKIPCIWAYPTDLL